MNRPTRLSLNHEWMVGDQIGAGGFGRVYAVTLGQHQAVAKLIPKQPGADRELLFVDLGDVRNVVPIIDSGETENEWVIVMPRAEKSLRRYLQEASGGIVSAQDTVSVLGDIAAALADLDGRVVHRDLKPENVLLLDGAWCLADFGISRYAEATTAPETQKFAWTPPYAAPERWRGERATSATDMYSLGVVGYEMLAGSRPFPGRGWEDYREQHLHSDPPTLEAVPPLLSSLLEECLYKAAGARPGPANFLARLNRIDQTAQSGGLARLSEVHRAEVSRRAAVSRQESQSMSVEESRRELAESAEKAVTRIADALRDSILGAAPSARHTATRNGWTIQLNQATLSFSGATRTRLGPWGGREPAFDVICHATLSLRIPEDHWQYEGRSHSLWFCDAQAQGEYAWFETAFMVMPFCSVRRRQNPFALEPGEESGDALARLAAHQVAWPFTRLEVAQLEDFIDRWAGWFGDAARGNLRHPSTVPEGPVDGTWRRK